MENKITTYNTDEVDLPANGNSRTIVSSRRSALLGFIAFLILATLVGAFIFQRYQNIKEEQKVEALALANNVKARLQASLAFSLSATKTLSFFIQADGSVSNFDSIASQILSSTNDIDALQLVPGGVIQSVYPLAGNEKAIGYDILKDSTTNKEALKAIQKNELFFAGPLNLRQGGIGVVGRLPVFRQGKFWGFTAVIIKLGTLIRSAGLDFPGKTGFYFQLSKINPNTGEEEFFIQHTKGQYERYFVSVDVPNGEWKLSVIPVRQYKSFDDIILLASLGVLLAALGGIFVFYESGKPKKLNELVKKRTRQLQESEENYKVLFEKSPLPLWIYDLGTLQIIEVNDAAIALYGYSREEFMELDLKAIRPEADIDDFVASSRESSNELRQAGTWSHYKKNKELIQVLIFARNIKYKSREGRLVLLMDVTEKVKIENELIKSEEKYRSLIEQASDGIILYSFDGTIHSFNKAAYTQAGYTIEEFKKLNLKDLFFDTVQERSGITGRKATSIETVTLYRKLKRKDGSIFTVELNTKMLADGKIIAIVRDITEREQTEAALKESEEKFSKAFHTNVLGFAIHDSERKLVDMNDAYAAIVESSRDKLLGRTADEAGLLSKIEPGRREAARKEVEQILKTQGQVRDFEVQITLNNGENAIVILSIEPLELNKKAHWLTSVINVSEKKKAEEALNKSNERFELIAQATNDAVWDHDFIKNETWGNEKLRSLYGYEKGNEKIDFEIFLSHIHPDERAGVELRMKQAIEGSASTLSEEFRFKVANGKYRNFYDRAYIKYNETGKPVRILGAMQDITDKELIKKQILKEKELSDSIINSLPGIFYLYNKEGKFKRWNKNFETVTGYSAEEISKLHPLNFFLEKDHALLTEKITNVFINGQDHVEADFLLKNKETIPYYFTGQAIEYEGESCLMGVGLDFSEKEKAKRQVIESETRYKELIEQASDAIFISDHEGRYIDVNTRACRMLGYTKEELLNMSGADILNQPVEANGLSSRYDELRSGESHIRETTLKRKDGSLIVVESNSKMLPDGRFIGIVRDLSERKKSDQAIRESEERYRALVENAPEALVVMDVERQKFVSVSETAVKLFGLSREELLQRGPVEVSTEFQPDGKLSSVAAKEYIDKALEGGKPSFEWTHKDKDDNPIPCEVWLVRLPSENNILIRGSILDISVRKKTEEEIQKNSERLRELYSYSQNVREEERKHIAREIHDELGQQLTGLKMDLFWINRRLKTDDELVKEKMSSTLTLIDTTIKTVRKIATELRPSILDDLGLIAALEWQGEEFEKRSDIKVKFTSSINETMILPNIATAFFRIYQELLTNVARHSGAENVNTMIYVDNDKLYLKVSDDGAGFNMKEITEKKTLGLTGIQERANLIGGTCEIKSKPGKGTNVLISVPLLNMGTNIK